MLYRETGQFKTSYSADMAIFPIRQDRIALTALLLFAFIGIPLLDAFQVWPLRGEYLLRAILIPFLILSLAAVGLNILTGYCGQLSLGSGAFMAIGAYSAYKFGTGIHIPLEIFTINIPPLPVFWCILLGGLMAAFVGILFGVPSLRIKGLYLAVATLAAQFFFDWLFIRVKWFTNYTSSGSVVAPELNFFGFYANKPIEKYLLCLLFVTVFALLAKNLVRGNIGRQWMAIRDMDIAAELMGIRPLYAKLTAFALSSFIIGVAGVIWAFAYLRTVEPDGFDLDRSFQILFIIIIGGLASIRGAFFGAALIVVFPLALSRLGGFLLGDHFDSGVLDMSQRIVLGALIILFLILEPDGLVALWDRIRRRLLFAWQST